MPTRPCIDLHTHSTASDGSLKPAELVAAAASAGVDTLALTDHDSVAGLGDAQAAAAEHGLRLVPGVEISVTWQRRTLHVAGLAFDPQNPALAAGLAGLQAKRAERAAAIAAKMEALGVTDALVRAEALADGGQITRSHFARLLIEAGYCKSMQHCFKRYLKPGKPAYAGAQWALLDEAIGWIQAAGGVAVLAHPHGYGMTHAWRERTVAAFAAAGGDALEVCTGTTTPRQIQASAADAARHDLAGSVGSDFHSPEQRWLKLGRLAPLPESIRPVWRNSEDQGVFK